MKTYSQGMCRISTNKKRIQHKDHSVTSLLDGLKGHSVAPTRAAYMLKETGKINKAAKRSRNQDLVNGSEALLPRCGASFILDGVLANDDRTNAHRRYY